MKHVIVHVGDQKLLSAVREVLQSREDLAIDFADPSADATVAGSMTAVLLTDLPRAEESLRAMRNGHRCDDFWAPVVVITTPLNEQLSVQALRDGAASYVPGRLVHSELSSTLDTVFAMTSARHERSRVMDCMAVWKTEFALENERKLISPLVRYFQQATQRMGLFDRDEETRLGVALEEALINSMVHGNLEISSSLRETDDRAFYRLIDERCHQEPYASRRVKVEAECSRSCARFLITDEGQGFDLGQVPDPTDPANVERVCGRGLLLMRTFMDEVVFHGVGNQVELVKRGKSRS